MTRILTFEQALEQTADTHRHLLLGNGFSIACDPTIFHYESLYAEASEKIRTEMPEAHKLFESLGTKDFEEVVRILGDAGKALPFYLPENTEILAKIQEHSGHLKNILISTIAENHPEFPASIPKEKFSACRRFLANFIHPDIKGRVYTLNYDLLLYWALMHEEADGDHPIDLLKNDGFGKDDPEDRYIVWVNEDHSHDQRVFYLHGAVHLFDAGINLEKYTWSHDGRPLIEQAREALSNGKFPLFVAEGNSDHKLEKIKHQPYLHHSYKSFISNTKESKGKKGEPKPLFIFGHSLDNNDDHIISRIWKGTISRLFVSIYGDPASVDNKRIIAKARVLVSRRDSRNPLEVNFYDAQSAQVWG